MEEQIAAEIQAARAAVGDITEAAEFCLSPIGLLTREDLEIALASEVLRLRGGLEACRTFLGDDQGYFRRAEDIDAFLKGERGTWLDDYGPWRMR